MSKGFRVALTGKETSTERSQMPLQDRIAVMWTVVLNGAGCLHHPVLQCRFKGFQNSPDTGASIVSYRNTCWGKKMATRSCTNYLITRWLTLTVCNYNQNQMNVIITITITFTIVKCENRTACQNVYSWPDMSGQKGSKLMNRVLVDYLSTKSSSSPVFKTLLLR